jgi:glucan-binding YG repeat protein
MEAKRKHAEQERIDKAKREKEKERQQEQEREREQRQREMEKETQQQQKEDNATDHKEEEALADGDGADDDDDWEIYTDFYLGDYECMKKSQIRSGWQMDSDKNGVLRAHTSYHFLLECRC